LIVYESKVRHSPPLFEGQKTTHKSSAKTRKQRGNNRFPRLALCHIFASTTKAQNLPAHKQVRQQQKLKGL
jgi:hypothetical protein